MLDAISKDFWPLGVGIHTQEEHLALKWTSKINVDSLGHSQGCKGAAKGVG